MNLRLKFERVDFPVAAKRSSAMDRAVIVAFFCGMWLVSPVSGFAQPLSSQLAAPNSDTPDTSAPPAAQAGTETPVTGDVPDVEDESSAQPVSGRPPAAEEDPVATQLYEAAMDALASGNRWVAESMLVDFIARYPSHPRMGDAARRLAMLRETPPERAPSPARGGASVQSEWPGREGRNVPRDRGTAEPPERTRPPGGAITELTISQGQLGILLGVELCYLAECGGWGYAAAAFALGAAAVGLSVGLPLSLGPSSLDTGDAATIASSTYWGAWIGLALGGMAAAEGVDNYAATGIAIAGQLSGLTVGVLLSQTLDVQSNEASMVRWFGAWGALLGLVGLGLNDFEASVTESFGVLLATSNLGLVSGILLSQLAPVSRGRMMVMTGGGALGGLVGAGMAMAFLDGYDHIAFWSAALGGAIAGFTTAALLTPRLDAGLDLQVGAAPIENGAMFSVSGQF